MAERIKRDEQGRPVEMVGPCGTSVWKVTWAEEGLSQLQVRLPDLSWMLIQPCVTERPVLGMCDAIYREGDEEPVTYFRTVDWTQPKSIPPLEKPGLLPSGAGTSILNTLSWLSELSGVRTLRYIGPYPTGSLFDSLFTCFRVVGPPEEAFSRFVDGVEEKSLQAELHEIPVNFIPDPFVPVWSKDGVCAQRRDELERVYIEDKSYHREADGSRRLQRSSQYDGGWDAVVIIAGQTWAHIASFDRKGIILEGPHALPELPDTWMGQPLHPGFQKLLTDALPPRAPQLLQESLRHVLSNTPILWGDTQTDWAQIQDGTIVLHATFTELAQQLDTSIVLEAITRAVEPVAQRLAQARLISDNH